MTIGKPFMGTWAGAPRISFLFFARLVSLDSCPLINSNAVQSETYQVQPEKVTHGYSGPLKVSYGGAFTNIGKEFLDVAAQYDKDRGMTDDANGLLECNVYGVSRVIILVILYSTST